MSTCMDFEIRTDGLFTIFYCLSNLVLVCNCCRIVFYYGIVNLGNRVIITDFSFRPDNHDTTFSYPHVSAKFNQYMSGRHGHICCM